MRYGTFRVCGAGVLALFCWATSALAVQGHNIDFGSARHGSTFSVDAADHLVAGTRCEFTVSIGGNPTQNFGQFPGISAIWISDIKINVGDIPGLNDPADPGLVYTHAPIHYPGGWNWMMFNRSLRIATTWFDDQELIGVRVRLKAHLVPPGGGPVVQDYDHTYYLTAHNKLQQLGNSTYFNPSPPPGAYAYNQAAEADSNGITTAAFDALFRSFRGGAGHASHSVHPGPQAMSETKTSVVDHLRESTAFCGATHGNALALLDSTSLPHPDDINFLDDVLPQIQSKSSAPKMPYYQLVVLYACGSLSGAASAFQIGDPITDPPSQGRGIMGFTQPVSYFAMSASRWQAYQADHTLGTDLFSKDHAALLLEKIGEGEFYTKALFDSNTAVKTLKPKSSTGSRTLWEVQPMEFIGDAFARIYYVYLTEAEYTSREQAGLPLNIWWLEIGGTFQ